MALVGTFLQEWAYLESALNLALENALKMDTLTFIIIRANIQLRDKIHIVKALINLLPLSEALRSDYCKTVEKIGDLSRKRNMMAHDAFGNSSKCDGVQFYVYKAKERLAIPETHWSIADFKREIQNLEGHRIAILKIAKELKGVDLNGPIEKPIKGLAGLALLGFQSRQTPI